jgi:hypothetical protein
MGKITSFIHAISSIPSYITKSLFIPILTHFHTVLSRISQLYPKIRCLCLTKIVFSFFIIVIIIFAGESGCNSINQSTPDKKSTSLQSILSRNSSVGGYAIPTLITMSEGEGVPCVEGDSILNAPDVQTYMHETYIEGHGPDEGPNSSPLPDDQRSEALGILYRGNDGNYHVENVPATSVNSCHFEGSVNSLPPNTVGLIHLHPYYDREEVDDPRCREHGPGITYDAQSVSRGDAETVKNNNLKMYVFDENSIRLLKPSSSEHYSEVYGRYGCY